MKRRLLALLIVATVGLLVAGCGSTETMSPPTENTTFGTAGTTTVTQPSTTTATLPVTTSQTTVTTPPATVGNERIEATGTFNRSTHTFNTSQGEGGVTIIEGADHLEFLGTLDGTWANQYILKVDPTTGKISMTADITFTGTVDGKEGQFTATEVATGQMSFGNSGAISGHTTIVDGTGELAGLRGAVNGNATFDAEGLRGTYTGELYFAE
jgi:uncharacterized protein YceK